MSQWSSRSVAYLKELARRYGKQDDLARETGIKKPTLQNILGGQGEPSIGKVAALANAFGVTVDEILAGGPDYDSPGAEHRALSDLKPGYIAQGGGFRIPALADVTASAGDGSLATLERLEPGPFAVDELWLRRQLGSLPDLRLVQVAGDSQEPDLHDADWIIIDQSKNELRNGLYVIVLDDCLMLKRIQLEGKFVQLLSRNPIYSGIGIDLTRDAERLRVIGKAVYGFRAMG